MNNIRRIFCGEITRSSEENQPLDTLIGIRLGACDKTFEITMTGDFYRDVTHAQKDCDARRRNGKDAHLHLLRIGDTYCELGVDCTIKIHGRRDEICPDLMAQIQKSYSDSEFKVVADGFSHDGS